MLGTIRGEERQIDEVVGAHNSKNRSFANFFSVLKFSKEFNFGIYNPGNLELSLYGSTRRVLDFINSDDFKEDVKEDIDIPYFNLQSILVATDNFAEANLLGEGGFGPVYKVILAMHGPVISILTGLHYT